MFEQEAEGDWLGPGDMGRREANGTGGAAVFADSNFTPDPDIPEGPQAPGTERYCFIGQPLARVGAFLVDWMPHIGERMPGKCLGNNSAQPGPAAQSARNVPKCMSLCVFRFLLVLAPPRQHNRPCE